MEKLNHNPQRARHKSPILFEISVIVTKKDSLPQLELRRRVSNTALIKTIISCAMQERPIIVLPAFKNKLRSISSMVEAGLIYYEPEDGGYYFNV